MMFASKFSNFNGSRYGFRLASISLILLSISCLKSLSSTSQVNAIISPKARICFNSMSTSFQSECVFCDSRLYGSTIIACTGQPILANNVTQAQAFCIATACLEQTGRMPVVLGRKKRSLLPSLSFNLNKNKQKLQNNGTVTAQLNKLVNGTTSGNLAFVVNKPSMAYIWSNPLTKVFTKNSPNKSFQWQFGKGQTVTAAAAAPAASAAGQMANPQAARPAAAVMATSGSNSPTPRPNWNIASINPPRASLAPVSMSQQQSNPSSTSLLSSPIDNIENGANGQTGSYVVLADGRISRFVSRQRLI